MVELVDPSDVFGHTVFCDDIRQEVTGKYIYIGVYQAAMIIHVPFPVKLSRIAFVVSVGQRAATAVPEMSFKIFLPGDNDDTPSIEAEVSEQSPGAFTEAAKTNADATGIPAEGRAFLFNTANLIFDGVEIKQAGAIKVRVDLGGKRYWLGSLPVVAAQSPKTET